MALDPDNELLIFKERGNKDKEKRVQEQATQKVEDKPVAEQQKPLVNAAPPVEAPKPEEKRHGFFGFWQREKEKEVQKPAQPVTAVKGEHHFFGRTCKPHKPASTGATRSISLQLPPFPSFQLLSAPSSFHP